MKNLNTLEFFLNSFVTESTFHINNGIGFREICREFLKNYELFFCGIISDMKSVLFSQCFIHLATALHWIAICDVLKLSCRYLLYKSV